MLCKTTIIYLKQIGTKIRQKNQEVKSKCEIFLISQRVNQRYHFSFEVEKLRIIGLSMVLTIIKMTTSRTKSELPMLPFRRLKKKNKGKRKPSPWNNRQKTKEREIVNWPFVMGSGRAWEEPGSLCLFFLVSSFLLWFKLFCIWRYQGCALRLWPVPSLKKKTSSYLILILVYFGGYLLGGLSICSFTQPSLDFESEKCAP